MTERGHCVISFAFFVVALIQCIYLKIPSGGWKILKRLKRHDMKVVVPVATMIPGTDFLLVIGPDV